MKRAALFALLLAGCGNLEGGWYWGTVLSVQPDKSALGCLYDLPVASVQLDDGRVFPECMNAAVGTRVQVCVGTCYVNTPVMSDPKAAASR